MWNDASPIREMRSRLRALLPPRAFLKRDRGDMLFVSNAPAIDPGFADVLGFTVVRRGQLAAFMPEAEWLVRFEARHRQPPDRLCTELMRFRGMPVADETLRCFVRGAKLMELSEIPPNEVASFDRAVRQLAAVAQRGGMDGGGLYALALIDYSLEQKIGGNIS